MVINFACNANISKEINTHNKSRFVVTIVHISVLCVRTMYIVHSAAYTNNRFAFGQSKFFLCLMFLFQLFEYLLISFTFLVR